MAQVNRLPADAAHGFGGGAIDRSKPVSFKVDGRAVDGFAGDTVLTSLLANGIDSVGTYANIPVALDERAAPLLSARGEPGLALPADRILAVSGLDLVTAGAGEASRGLLGKLLSGFSSKPGTLGLRLDDLPPAPWLDREPDVTLQADVLVVGGGVAGLSAASSVSGRVVLAERRPWLGGDARYFGTTGDDEAPDAAIARLAAGHKAEVLLSAEVFAISGTTARVHQVSVAGGRLNARIVAIEAKRIVLATGSFERLPLFAGNRLPGVVGAIAAFHRADRYGVWLGKRALFSTPGGHGYRLALLAKDAGLDVQRIADTRLGPNSRFIDFCKASGVSFTNGLVPQSAVQVKGKPGLTVGFAVAIDDIRQETSLTETDQFVAGGALQPDLSLWLHAGGPTAWDGTRLSASGELPGVVLAGSAAGYRGIAACIASGKTAATAKSAAIADPDIEAIYETPDAATPIAPSVDPRLPAFLDRGATFAARPADPEAFTHPSAIGLGELAAAVQLGAIPAASAGQVAAERGIAGADIVDTGWRVPAAVASTELPAFLTGRFGPKPQLCVITSADARYFERGCLVFLGSAIQDPTQAIGVIVGPAPNRGVGGLALIERDASKGDTRLFVRDAGGAVPVERIEKA
jgi:sarcosine oxidase subunit alpha